MGRLFTLPPNLVQVYQDGIDTIIEEMGRSVTLAMPPTSTDCPNCGWDSFRKRSDGRYTPGGPKEFKDGQVCPWCKGQGKINSYRNVVFNATVGWNPDDFDEYAQRAVEEPGTIVKIKTYRTYEEDVRQAIHAKVEDNICKLIGKPIPRGLRESRYTVTYWRVIS